MFELYAERLRPFSFGPNAALRNDNVWTVDTGYSYTAKKGLEISVGAFTNGFSGMRTTNDQEPVSLVNGPSSVAVGADLRTKLQLSDAVRLHLNATAQHFLDPLSMVAMNGGPAFKSNLILDADIIAGLRCNVALGYISEQDYVAVLDQTYPLKASTRIDAHFYSDLNVEWRHGSGFFMALNLNNFTRIGQAAAVKEFPGGAQAIGARIMLRAGFESLPLDRIADDAKQASWWAAGSALFFGLVAAATPAIIGSLGR